MGYVNIHSHKIFGEDAFETVYKNRYEAAEAAEEHASTYLYSLSHEGQIDLREYFSERYKHEQAQAERADHAIDVLKDGLRTINMRAI